MVSYLDKRLKMNLKNMKEKVASDEALNKKVENIITAPSLGFTSVITVIAETNGFALIQNRKQLTSYAGFDVKDNQSGNVEGHPESQKRQLRIRAILYMPAVHKLTAQQASKRSLRQDCAEASRQEDDSSHCHGTQTTALIYASGRATNLMTKTTTRRNNT